MQLDGAGSLMLCMRCSGWGVGGIGMRFVDGLGASCEIRAVTTADVGWMK